MIRLVAKYNYFESPHKHSKYSAFYPVHFEILSNNYKNIDITYYCEHGELKKIKYLRHMVIQHIININSFLYKIYTLIQDQNLCNSNKDLKTYETLYNLAINEYMSHNEKSDYVTPFSQPIKFNKFTIKQISLSWIHSQNYEATIISLQ